MCICFCIFCLFCCNFFVCNFCFRRCVVVDISDIATISGLTNMVKAIILVINNTPQKTHRIAQYTDSWNRLHSLQRERARARDRVRERERGYWWHISVWELTKTHTHVDRGYWLHISNWEHTYKHTWTQRHARAAVLVGMCSLCVNVCLLGAQNALGIIELNTCSPAPLCYLWSVHDDHDHDATRTAL